MRRFIPSTFFEWLVVVIAIVGIVTFWNGRKDSQDSAKTAVAKERVRVDTLIDKRDSVGRVAAEHQLDEANATISRLIGRIRATPQPIPVGTPHDSVTNLTAALKVCRDDSKSLLDSIPVLQSACSAYRDSAKTSLANKDKRYNDLDALYKLSRVEKRLQPYGDVMYEPLKQRTIVDLGVTSKLFWKLHAKAELQYAVPRAVRDSTDGFRLLVGGHLKF